MLCIMLTAPFMVGLKSARRHWLFFLLSPPVSTDSILAGLPPLCPYCLCSLSPPLHVHCLFFCSHILPHLALNRLLPSPSAFGTVAL